MLIGKIYKEKDQSWHIIFCNYSVSLKPYFKTLKGKEASISTSVDVLVILQAYWYFLLLCQDLGLLRQTTGY